MQAYNFNTSSRSFSAIWKVQVSLGYMRTISKIQNNETKQIYTKLKYSPPQKNPIGHSFFPLTVSVWIKGLKQLGWVWGFFLSYSITVSLILVHDANEGQYSSSACWESKWVLVLKKKSSLRSFPQRIAGEVGRWEKWKGRLSTQSHMTTSNTRS